MSMYFCIYFVLLGGVLYGDKTRHYPNTPSSTKKNIVLSKVGIAGALFYRGIKAVSASMPGSNKDNVTRGGGKLEAKKRAKNSFSVLPTKMGD